MEKQIKHLQARSSPLFAARLSAAVEVLLSDGILSVAVFVAAVDELFVVTVFVAAVDELFVVTVLVAAVDELFVVTVLVAAVEVVVGLVEVADVGLVVVVALVVSPFLVVGTPYKLHWQMGLGVTFFTEQMLVGEKLTFA